MMLWSWIDCERVCEREGDIGSGTVERRRKIKKTLDVLRKNLVTLYQNAFGVGD
jgi:hypothetical protein